MLSHAVCRQSINFETTDASSFLDGVATLMGGTVLSHMTVGDDMDLVAIEGAVRGLHF